LGLPVVPVQLTFWKILSRDFVIAVEELWTRIGMMKLAEKTF
jgi:hypothetical protein